MFATCSNDTVFGLPIFEAVLPGNVADIYSVAPVQLLVFNPLSMAVIALGDDARDASGRKLSAAAKLRGVAASVLTNPIVRWSCRCGAPRRIPPTDRCAAQVLSTALGLCFNLAGMHLPVFAETAVRRLVRAGPWGCLASAPNANAGVRQPLVSPPPQPRALPSLPRPSSPSGWPSLARCVTCRCLCSCARAHLALDAPFSPSCRPGPDRRGVPPLHAAANSAPARPQAGGGHCPHGGSPAPLHQRHTACLCQHLCAMQFPAPSPSSPR